MHDIVIRGGTIVDGTGTQSYTGDVAIDGDKIAQIGGKAGPGKREIDANGQLVTPGWVDIHTHYDGQATWDPVLAPSSWHGVTTVLMGNCGVGFAPVRKADHDCLIDLMEGVEDIPGIAPAGSRRRASRSFTERLLKAAKAGRAANGFSDVVRPRMIPTGRPATCAVTAAPPARALRTPFIRRW